MNAKEGFIKVTVNMPKLHHRKLKAIAALKGVSFSTYIMECIEKATLQEKEINGKICLADETVKEVEELIEAAK